MENLMLADERVEQLQIEISALEKAGASFRKSIRCLIALRQCLVLAKDDQLRLKVQKDSIHLLKAIRDEIQKNSGRLSEEEMNRISACLFKTEIAVRRSISL